jgi:hypothetical protein
MKKLSYTLQFYSHWLQADKDGQSFSHDVVPVLEDNGQPIFGGKALKGLVKDQLKLLADQITCEPLKDAIKNYKEANSLWSQIRFSTATLKSHVPQKYQYALFDTLAYTALDDKKNAKQGSLRTIKAVVPTILMGSIEIPESTDQKVMITDLNLALRLIKEAGYNRYKGFGRCRIQLNEDGNAI